MNFVQEIGLKDIMGYAYSPEDIRVIIGFLAGRIPQLHNVKMKDLNEGLKDAFDNYPPSIEVIDFNEERHLLLQHIEKLEEENRILKS